MPECSSSNTDFTSYDVKEQKVTFHKCHDHIRNHSIKQSSSGSQRADQTDNTIDTVDWTFEQMCLELSCKYPNW